MCPKMCQLQCVKLGFFVRKSDGRRIQRWRCPKCLKATSNAVRSPCYGQNKRHLNPRIRDLLCSAVSQRRIALLLKVSRLTVARKFIFLSKQAALENKKLKPQELLKELYVDEMEDRIHTKLKPVSIALAVSEQRKILSHRVAKIRPKNLKLNQLSKSKYPSWIPTDRKRFKELVSSLKQTVHPEAKFYSDSKSSYCKPIQKSFPKSRHYRYPSRRAVVAGQGEMKEGGRDPLFALNHTCASLRANINRLIRRTWCTSKKMEALSAHIELYTWFHNTVLT